MTTAERKPVLVVLSGAGISRESGIKTFRDGDGLWEDHDVMEVATPQAWARDPDPRAALLQCPSAATSCSMASCRMPLIGPLLALESHFDVRIVTQNVDDLHERGPAARRCFTCMVAAEGSAGGRPSGLDDLGIVTVGGEVGAGTGCCLGLLGDVDARGVQWRPHVVWFGEAVPMSAAMEPPEPRAETRGAG